MQNVNEADLKTSETSVCFLYRYFDKYDKLLYIGVSNNSITRFKQHIKSSIWIEFAARSTMETYKSRKEVLKAEKEAIQKEQPIFNWNLRIKDRDSLSKEEAQWYEDAILTDIDFYINEYYVKESRISTRKPKGRMGKIQKAA